MINIRVCVSADSYAQYYVCYETFIFYQGTVTYKTNTLRDL